MELVVSLTILIIIIIWASRVERGINTTNESLARIEKHLNHKKGKK